jgi:hypothetical protein
MKSMAYMTLRLVVATLLWSRSMGDEQRINYGVIFQKHLNIDFATDYCNHVYEIPMHLYLDLDQKPMKECSTKFDDCIAYKQVLIQINHIRSYMTSQTKLTKDLIFKMIPQVTTKLNGDRRGC